MQRVLLLNIDLDGTQRKVLPENLTRRSALFVNDSDSVCYLCLGSPAVANQGIRINASGGSYEITPFNLFTGDVYAISTGVTKRLMITEVSHAIE